MIPSIVNLPYFPTLVPIGSGGVLVFDLVSPATPWLIMLAILAIYGLLMHVVTKPRPRVRVAQRHRPRRLGMRGGFSAP